MCFGFVATFIDVLVYQMIYLSLLRLHSYQKHTGCLSRGRIEAERGWGRWMRLGCMKQSNLSPHSPRANWWACCSSPSGLSCLPRAARWRTLARRYSLAVRKTHSCSSAGLRWNPSDLDDPQHARPLPATRNSPIQWEHHVMYTGLTHTGDVAISKSPSVTNTSYSMFIISSCFRPMVAIPKFKWWRCPSRVGHRRPKTRRAITWGHHFRVGNPAPLWVTSPKLKQDRPYSMNEETNRVLTTLGEPYMHGSVKSGGKNWAGKGKGADLILEPEPGGGRIAVVYTAQPCAPQRTWRHLLTWVAPALRGITPTWPPYQRFWG